MSISLFDEISSRLVLLRERGTILAANKEWYISIWECEREDREVPNLYSADEETKFLD